MSTCLTSQKCRFPSGAILSDKKAGDMLHFQASSSSLSSDSLMTSRTFCIPGVIFLAIATVLLIITSISLPFLPAVDFVRAHVQSGNVAVANSPGVATSQTISQLKASELWSLNRPYGLNECRLTSLDYGPIVLSKPLLEIATAAAMDTRTASLFGTARPTLSLSSPVGLEAWRFTQSVRNHSSSYPLQAPLTRSIS